MALGRISAADSRRFSVMDGLRRRRVLMRWAWTWLRSLVVLHLWRIRVLGFCGNWGITVMLVRDLAGEIEIGRVVVETILFSFGLLGCQCL